jgi:hypothetical protein
MTRVTDSATENTPPMALEQSRDQVRVKRWGKSATALAATRVAG